ncbi:hypothetical protein BGX33_004033 [Mortierella sp. NVP41]|nr:hypothetical protein BGX33_004033 [Mortierella sp. NVP41]
MRTASFRETAAQQESRLTEKTTQHQEQPDSSISDDTLRIHPHPGQLVETIDLSMLPHRWETVHFDHIQTLVQGCPHLSSLDLSNCRILRDNAVQSIAEELGPRNLQSLILSGCTKLTDISVLSVCAHAVRLENLELSECDRLSDISILELGSAVIQTRRVASGIKGSTAKSLVSIESLVSAETAGSPGSEPQLRGTSQTLRSLDLSHCTRITERGVQGLRQGAVQLTSLNLEGCYGVLASDDDLGANEWEDLEDEDEDEPDLDSDLDVVSY